MLVTVNVADCDDTQTSFINMATAAGTAPDGSTTTDNSVNGSDPDGTDNDGNPDEESGTNVSFDQMPSLGVAKRNVKTELLPDGSANVTFEFNLENFGNVDLSGISLVDDLSATFGMPCEVSVMSLTSRRLYRERGLQRHHRYRAVGYGQRLPVGDKGAVLVTVNVADCDDTQTSFVNMATAAGTAPDGSTTTDNSVNGSDPDGTDNDGNPDEESGTNVSFDQMPSLGVAKRNVKTELLPDGSANVTFEFNLENFGNVDLSGISLVDDLSATFGMPCEVSVMSLTSDDFIVNAAYDGVITIELLAGQRSAGRRQGRGACNG